MRSNPESPFIGRPPAQRCPTLAAKKLTPHVLRHTAAMTLLREGVDVAVIALWLGHADIRSTDAYLHADMTIKERALARLTPAIRQTGPLPATRHPAGVPGEPVIIPTPGHPPPSKARPHQREGDPADKRSG